MRASAFCMMIVRAGLLQGGEIKMLLYAIEQVTFGMAEDHPIDQLLDERFELFRKNDEEKWQIWL